MPKVCQLGGLSRAVLWGIVSWKRALKRSPACGWLALILCYCCNYLVCKDAYQGVGEPPSAAGQGRTAASEQGGLKPKDRSWRDALWWGLWQEHARDHKQGITEFGIKGKGESVGTGRIVRSEGPTLPRDRGLPNGISSPGCIQHPAALGDAATASCTPFI